MERWLCSRGPVLALSLQLACTGLVTGDGGPGGPGGPGGGQGGGLPPVIDAPVECEGGGTAPLRAFPGAQGFGAFATGGRGGTVIKVTNLNASGPGSLQAALNVNEPRIIVFDVSGVIEGDIEVPYGNVTVAGQTAPGAGITIRGRLTGEYSFGVDNMIFRHIRVRPDFSGGDGRLLDSIQFSRNANLIFDHISVAFGVDETVDMYEAKDVTFQWSVIESSATNGHPEGEHNYGLINGPDGARVSVHHNLFAHHKNRNPAIANGPAEVRNNVHYNIRHAFVHHNPASGKFNIAGNYYKAGPDATMIPFFFDDENGFGAADLEYYLADNFIDDASSDCRGAVQNPWNECSQDLNAGEELRGDAEFSFTAPNGCFAPVVTESSADSFDSVLAGSGAFPRDVVTRASVEDARNGTGSWGAYDPGDMLSGLTPVAPPSDSDSDGIADDWESANGLNPNDGGDYNTIMDSGYTAIEAYINGLADQLVYAE